MGLCEEWAWLLELLVVFQAADSCCKCPGMKESDASVISPVAITLQSRALWFVLVVCIPKTTRFCRWSGCCKRCLGQKEGSQILYGIK